MIQELIPRLGESMGKFYRGATLLCLENDFNVGEEIALEQAFYLKIVGVLDQCSA